MTRAGVRGRLFAAAAALAAAAGLAAVEAAAPVFWRVSTEADFLRGEVENLSVDPDGRLRLGPRIDLVHEAADAFAWSLAAARGALWAAVGNRVVRIDADGGAETVFEAQTAAVQALAVGPGGTVYAASSPNGRVVALEPDGAVRDVFAPDEPYVWALAVDSEGGLLVATGNPGRIHRVAPDGAASLLHDPRAAHVRALAVDAQGRVLAGAASPGRVLRIDADGRAFVLLEAGLDEITALRVADDGVIHAAAGSGRPSGTPSPAPPPAAAAAREPVASVSVTTQVTAVVTTAGALPIPAATGGAAPAGGTAGEVYRIAPDGVWDVIWRSAEDTPYDLADDGAGGLLVGAGPRGRVFRVSGAPPRTVLLARAPAQQVTRFAAGPGGALHYATANPARVYRLAAGLAAAGSYVSEARDAGAVAAWGAIRWRAETPAGSSVRLFTRSGNTAAPGPAWSDWSEAYTRSAGTPISSPKARYLQWKAELRGSDAAPALLSVTTAYLPRNLPPEVTAVTVHPPGEAFQETFGSDPPLAGFEPGGGAGGEAAGDAAASAAPTLGRRVVRRGLQTFTWTAQDGNQDRLRFDLHYREEDAAAWRVLAPDLAGTIFTWDTTSVPDGAYEVRVEATDGASNPPGAALRGARASAPFDIDNTPPAIAFDPVRRDGGATVVPFTVRDTWSPVLRVEYAAGPGRWQVVHPVDGIPDSREERFDVQAPASAEQAGRLVVRAADAMGNVTTAAAPLR